MDSKKAINDSLLEEMLYFSLKESVEFAKSNNDDFFNVVQKKVELKYWGEDERKEGFSDFLASKVMNPVFWYISSENRLIPSNGSGKWVITEEAKNLTDNDFKDLSKTIFKEYEIYLKSNFKIKGYEIN